MGKAEGIVPTFRMNSVKLDEDGPDEDDEWVELEKFDEPKKEFEEDYSVNQIVDNNFVPLTFKIKPDLLPGILAPIIPNMTLQEIESLNEKESAHLFKIKNLCCVTIDDNYKITSGFI